MDDERCRITVVGKRRRVDLALPARAPIAEYIPALTRLCGQESDETLPAAWSLAPAGDRPFHPSISLLEAQVVDGATLYLKDLVEGETDGPVITELEDLVGEVQDQWDRWNGRHRALTVIGLGAAGFVAALAALVLGVPDPAVGGLIAIVAGFALALVAGVATRRGWPMPARLCLAVALAAVPVLALAGYALPVSRSSETAAAIAVVVGANVGTLGALIAMLNVWTLTAELLALVALPVTILLALLHATRLECAAVVGVVGLIMLSAAPSAAGRLTALPPARAVAGPVDAADEVATILARSRRVLVVLTLAVTLIVAGCLVLLGGSNDVYAGALALCVSLALLAQAGHSNVPLAVMLMMGAGVTGLVTLVVRAPVTLLHATSPVLGPVMACGLCAILLCVGLAMVMLPSSDVEARPAWLNTVAVVLSVFTVPLAVGVFGVFEYLAGLGGRL
ncbi:MAG: EsaB/YukD family protein [Actinoallomurus sp.]